MDMRVKRLVFTEHPAMEEATHDVDPNRTMYVDELATDEELEGKILHAKTMDEVFKEMRPQVHVSTDTPEGESIDEKLDLRSMQEFDLEKIVLKSRGLERLSNRADALANLKDAVQTNQRWRELLDSPEKRAEMNSYLEWIITLIESMES